MRTSIYLTNTQRERLARLQALLGNNSMNQTIISLIDIGEAMMTTKGRDTMITRLDLLHITNLDIAQKAAGRYLVDDNGAPADGSAWLIPASELPNSVLNEIITDGAGFLVHGAMTEYDGDGESRANVSDRAPHWCGFSSRGEAYYVDLVVLYEDNAGGLYLHYDDRYWSELELSDSNFQDDAKAILRDDTDDWTIPQQPYPPAPPGHIVAEYTDGEIQTHTLSLHRPGRTAREYLGLV